MVLIYQDGYSFGEVEGRLSDDGVADKMAVGVLWATRGGKVEGQAYPTVHLGSSRVDLWEIFRGQNTETGKSCAPSFPR